MCDIVTLGVAAGQLAMRVAHGCIGVARGVKTALIGKVLGNQGGSSESIVSAIQWAVENGAHVISISLGMDFPDFQKQLQQGGIPQEAATSMTLEGYRANVLLFERLASTLKALGSFVQPVMVVAAAGNESKRPPQRVDRLLWFDARSQDGLIRRTVPEAQEARGWYAHRPWIR